MKEVGIDISGEISKSIDMKIFMQSNVIVKLCEQLNEKCPVVPFAIKNVQWDVADPLTAEDQLEEVRAARDQIRLKILELFRELNIPVNE